MKRFEQNNIQKLDATQTSIEFNSENKKTWREKVGEDIFCEKMKSLNIGPGLYDKVKTDENGNVLEVDGLSYEEWNNKMKELFDGPDYSWVPKNQEPEEKKEKKEIPPISEKKIYKRPVDKRRFHQELENPLFNPDL